MYIYSLPHSHLVLCKALRVFLKEFAFWKWLLLLFHSYHHLLVYHLLFVAWNRCLRWNVHMLCIVLLKWHSVLSSCVLWSIVWLLNSEWALFVAFLDAGELAWNLKRKCLLRKYVKCLWLKDRPDITVLVNWCKTSSYLHDSKHWI